MAKAWSAARRAGTEEHVMNSIICKLIGHVVKFHDSGYPVCNRCGRHGYYDEYAFERNWFYWPLRLAWEVHYWLINFRYRRWRKRVWKNKDDIPF